MDKTIKRQIGELAELAHEVSKTGKYEHSTVYSSNRIALNVYSKDHKESLKPNYLIESHIGFDRPDTEVSEQLDRLITQVKHLVAEQPFPPKKEKPTLQVVK